MSFPIRAVLGLGGRAKALKNVFAQKSLITLWYKS